MTELQEGDYVEITDQTSHHVWDRGKITKVTGKQYKVQIISKISAPHFYTEHQLKKISKEQIAAEKL